MSATRLEDHEVELLLSGSVSSSAGMTELEQFVAVLSTDEGPPRDVSFMASSLAAVARSSGRSRNRGFRRVAVVMSSTAMLIGLSGIAMAADGSAPGDALYGVDRALERIGIGDGGVEERIQEFDVLIERGEEDEALQLLSDIAADGTEPEAAHRLQAATGIDLPDGQTTPHPEAVDPGARGQENPAGQPATPETVPNAPAKDSDESSGDEGNTDGSNGNGNAVGHSEDTQPPGQEEQSPGQEKPKENNGQGNANGTEENNDQGNAVGQSEDTQPPGQVSEPPGQEQPPGQEEQPPGQEKPKENNGQRNANGPGENNGQGNTNGPD